MSITRERLLEIIVTGPEASGAEQNELARMALAAMDSESECLPLDYLQGHKDGLEWAAQLAEANHPETGDWLYDDPIELAEAIRKGPDMPPAQPAADSEPVENHIGSKNALDAIVSFIKSKSNPTVKCYEGVSEQLFKDNCHGIHSHVIEYILKLGEELEDLRAEQAEMQPAPVVPDDVLDALQKVARIRLDMNDFDGDRRGIADCLYDAEEALIEVVNRRAAMLQAAPVCTCPSGDGSLRWPCPVHPGNSPVIPDGWTCNDKANAALMMLDRIETVDPVDDDRVDGIKRIVRELAAAPQSPGSEPATVPGKWIPVSEQMPDVGVKVLCFPAKDEPIHATFNGQLWLQDVSWSGSEEPIDNVIPVTVTHWMPLPAAPQEAINALISVVSRNEPEGK